MILLKRKPKQPETLTIAEIKKILDSFSKIEAMWELKIYHAYILFTSFSMGLNIEQVLDAQASNSMLTEVSIKHKKYNHRYKFNPPQITINLLYELRDYFGFRYDKSLFPFNTDEMDYHKELISQSLSLAVKKSGIKKNVTIDSFKLSYEEHEQFINFNFSIDEEVLELFRDGWFEIFNLYPIHKFKPADEEQYFFPFFFKDPIMKPKNNLHKLKEIFVKRRD